MVYGVLADGSLKKPSFIEIFDRCSEALKASWGDIDTSSDSPEGNLIGTISDDLSKLWEGVEASYFAPFVAYAPDLLLDDAAERVGVRRIRGQKTTIQNVTLTNTTDSPYLVPIGTLLRQSATAVEFQTLNEVTIPATGSVLVNIESVNMGAFTASEGSINTIVNPVSGFSSVSNTSLQVVRVGRAKETNAELRRRTTLSINKSKGGVTSAIANRVYEEVEGVSYTDWRENRGDTTDANGLPRKTFEVIVEGGVDIDVAQKINECQPAGINSYGTTSVDILDSRQNLFTIKFSRINDIQIYLIINLTVNSLYNSSSDLIIKNLLANLKFERQETIFTYKLIPALSQINGIESIDDIFQAITPTPTTNTKIIIGANERAKISAENVIINKTIV